MSRPKPNFSQKVEKDMPEFVSEVVGLTPAELDARLAQIAKDLDEVNQAREADEELEQTREKATQLNAPYAESRKALNMKTRYIIELLKEKGQI